ncbi:MAG: hypothetical protein DSY91_01060 [Deltaproteobacteria bacterium]|nr:MAG: hypothetical protein DSY91_01060 [Deltaproteobacteria bacterium]
MKIGIMSDTHDNLPYIERAVEVLNEADVNLVLHLGDYCAPFALRPLEGLKSDWIGVFGNNDGEIQGLTKASGGRIKSGNLSLEIEGKRIFLDHVNPMKDALSDSGHFDLICYGHTHALEVYEKNGCLCVNPGEVCGYLTNRRTVVCLDLSDLNPRHVEVIDLD